MRAAPMQPSPAGPSYHRRMSLREFLRTRRQRKAGKRYERDKALRDSQNDQKAIDRVADGAKTLGSGLG